ncbi:hypothetical protein SCACP_14520 [Sporomusa carbonis]|uniref:PilW family protein n=1 Tax=Sporomusa carbonis TaxID=3076075 RepID=UPI003A696C78
MHIFLHNILVRAKEQRGFTLVELMVGMTLTVLLMTAVFGLLFTSLRSWQNGKSHAEIQQAARIATDTIARNVRYAYTVSSSDGKTLRLTTDPAGANTVVFGVDPTTKALCITQGNGTPQPLAGNGMNGQEGTIIIIDNRFSVQGKLVSIIITAQDKTTGATFTCQTSMAALNN